ncbi:MAG: L-seryl-tRNA(Ser) seleniumtransferase [Planctomycetota bacterium]|jgi:L-seryl-tRNA(Ser) seleniumtransferase
MTRKPVSDPSQPAAAETNPYRLLPPIDECLRAPELAPWGDRIGRSILRDFAQQVLERWRTAIRSDGLDATTLQARIDAGDLTSEIAQAAQREAGRGVVRAINATGVVLNTGLGRSPVHPEVADSMRIAAASYCVLEVDRFSGKRNQRDEQLSVLCNRLVGSEAAIAVNNNAAAAFLMMHTFARDKEAIVSRGEQVEIGGSFRVPDILSSAGAHMVEVGTTNRTRIRDYEKAITDRTGLLIKIHRSNFRLVGFQEEVEIAEMAELGRARDVTVAFDLGSGLIEYEGARPMTMLEGETRVRDAVECGTDAVSFSGDKLFGGPQAGVIVGRRDAIEELRANALYRALRLDKTILVGLEETMKRMLTGRGDSIPARAMMHTTAEELRIVAQRLAARIEPGSGWTATVEDSQSEPGSGSAPGVYLASSVVRLRHESISLDVLANRLRAGDPPVFARVQEGALWIDPRTLLEGDEGDLIAALHSITH